MVTDDPTIFVELKGDAAGTPSESAVGPDTRTENGH